MQSPISKTILTEIEAKHGKPAALETLELAVEIARIIRGHSPEAAVAAIAVTLAECSARAGIPTPAQFDPSRN